MGIAVEIAIGIAIVEAKLLRGPGLVHRDSH